jgi:hypothetical protein
MNTRMGLSILRFVLGLVVGGYSLALIRTQISGRTHHALIFLGLAELAAAILFLIPATVRLGGISLIVVFLSAAAFHVLHGEYDIGYLGVYCAAVFAVISARGGMRGGRDER